MPKKIIKFTPAQIARFDEWAEKWVAIGLSTEPADFDKATEAALKAYQLCDLKRPMVILRMGSPYGAILGGTLAYVLLKEMGSKVASQVWSRVESQVASQVGSQVWSRVESHLKSASHNSYHGSFWASWAAYISFLRDVAGWSNPILERFEIDEALIKNCGWIWWHENILAVSDRPQIINRDAEGRLHCENGPSIAYRDGWSLWRIHGVAVPEQIITRPETITVSAIEAEQNAEVRRVICERYKPDAEISGYAAYLLDSGAVEIDRDETSLADEVILYRKEVPNDEPIVMVKLKNSTPEPDGRIKDYMLRVPPDMTTALDAIGWTFGLDKGEYAPKIET